MKKMLFYLNTVIMLPFYLIGKCFYGMAIACNWIMDKIDFRYNLINDIEDDGQRFNDD